MDKETTMPIWTPRALAEAANVTGSYIRLLLTTGKLQGQKMGGIWIIPYEEGQRWLDERAAESESSEEDKQEPLTAA